MRQILINALLILTVVVIALTIGFLVSAGVTWVLCWAFELTFTWKIAIGIWIIMIILSSIIRVRA